MTRQASRLASTFSFKIFSAKPSVLLALSSAQSQSQSQSRQLGSTSNPSVVVFVNTSVICHGITEKNGTFHTKQAIKWDTKMFIGARPKKDGTKHLRLPPGNEQQQQKWGLGAVTSSKKAKTKVKVNKDEPEVLKNGFKKVAHALMKSTAELLKSTRLVIDELEVWILLEGTWLGDDAIAEAYRLMCILWIILKS
ncbi:hypothetical protein Cgig2_017237 [Carnegiea gigantea]|uniref:CoA-binding domain-containing protein n=1 Tax=Carnegiea gigantea TaxID=171969 RepID=A0A9Q1GUY6_9CARY|nr:hypothetical protein Cgig2_017237 [Carnegiea gigantea]